MLQARPPRRNIEIKARCNDLSAAREPAKRAGAEFCTIERQLDTYFRCEGGRLKLRLAETGRLRRAEIVRYNRADTSGPRASSYTVRPVRWPRLTRWWLSTRRGIKVEVLKKREIWLWRGVRIHLDEVEGLGSFVELEAVVDDIGDESEARRRCMHMIGALGINESDMLENSYCDMKLGGRRD
jgi:adenylate cyclase class IV